VSEVGSVGVQRLFDVERTATLLQLVSTVEARLRGDALSAIPALFPAGSMTGAPKRAAMQHLATMEEGPRGIYSGAWGRIACDGSLDLAVVIRSAVVRGDTATVGAGGGITALSDPSAEWEEILLKAAPLLEALGAAG
jgi:anthranilate/para-aminobenzoate synthase component I